MRSFNIIWSNHIEHNICPICIDEVDDAPIPTFSSSEQAIRNGWITSSHIKFCPPNKKFVWICPKCVDRLSSNYISLSKKYLLNRF